MSDGFMGGAGYEAAEVRDRSEIWSSLLALAFGGFVTWSGYSLPLGTFTNPGSGYLLFYTGIGMCMLSLSMLYGAVSGPKTAQEAGSDTPVSGWMKPAVVIAILVAFVLLFEPLGFILSSMLLLLALLRAIEPVRWSAALPVAVITPLVVWYALERLLRIQVPDGVFSYLN